jgi:hypothetical protein
MMRKLLVVTSFGAGYVAGAAAGRERYEQIRRIVLGVAHDPKVQHLAGEAAEFAQQHGSAVADKITDKVTGHHAESPVAEQPTAEDINRSLHL